MRWVPDTTGRFAQRPHYDPNEIDAECESLVSDFLRNRHGTVDYPISTDDLMVLLERETADLDIYSDLSTEGPEVQGVTLFDPKGKPAVKISRQLSEDAWGVNRFRTTATHELGHVRFHNFLWPLEPRPALFFPDELVPAAAANPVCKRDNIQSIRATDWMEWQAGYACGSFLMPISALLGVVRGARAPAAHQHPTSSTQPLAGELIHTVAAAFQVSADAARVRLIQLRLFDEHAASTAVLPM